MSRLPSISTLALALVPAALCADYGGRMERVLREAVSATRVAPPGGATAPSTVATADVPGCASPPVPLALDTAIAGISTVPAVPTLAPVPAPAGPFRAIPAPAPSSVRLPAPAIAARPTPALASAPAPASAALPMSELASVPAPAGPFRAIPAPAGMTPSLPPPPQSAARVLARPTPPPLAPNYAALAAGRLVRDGLADGSLNPRNPAWRPYLTVLLENPDAATDSEALFATLLAGCAGHDERARLAAAETWAAGYAGGRHAPIIAYASARRAFTSGDYAAAAHRCERILADHPALAERAMLLLAMARAQTGDRVRALQILAAFRADHPDSPAVPEARYMEAWIALQEMRNEEAVAILRDITAQTPRAPAAAKAAKMLAALEGIP